MYYFYDEHSGMKASKCHHIGKFSIIDTNRSKLTAVFLYHGVDQLQFETLLCFEEYTIIIEFLLYQTNLASSCQIFKQSIE